MIRFCVVLLGVLTLQTCAQTPTSSSQENDNLEDSSLPLVKPPQVKEDGVKKNSKLTTFLSELMEVQPELLDETNPAIKDIQRIWENKDESLFWVATVETGQNQTKDGAEIRNKSTVLLQYSLKPTVDDSFEGNSMKNLSKAESPLVRKKRTFQMPCMVCGGGGPSIVISLPMKKKRKGCGKRGCGGMQRPPPCGYPQCGGPPPPPPCGHPQCGAPPVYHPPPPPRPPPPPQQPYCDPCQQRHPNYPMPMQQHPGYGGSYSQSSAQSSSSSYSSGWGKK